MNFENLKGQHLISVIVDREKNEVEFNVKDSDGNIKQYLMYHWQECSEAVWIEDIIGDIEDLQDATVLMSEVAKENDTYDNLWTFYRIQTNKGHVDFRWCGVIESYSVEVDFIDTNFIDYQK